MSGFIVMQRSALDHPLLKDAERFRAWFWLVGRAVWKRTRFDIAGKIVTLEPGQICVSRNQLATEWGWSPSAVERFLTRLQTEQMIGRETGQGRSIITISNYAKYQEPGRDPGQATGQATGQRPDSDRTTKEPLNQLTIEPNGSNPPVVPHAENAADEGLESTPPPAKPGKRMSRLPDDWKPILTASAQRIVDGWPPGKFDHELTRFRDHAADKGRLSKDWQAAFRTWIGKANEWHQQERARGGGSGHSGERDRRDGFTRAIHADLGLEVPEQPASSAGRRDAREGGDGRGSAPPRFAALR